MERYRIIAHYGDVELHFDEVSDRNVAYSGGYGYFQFFVNVTVRRWRRVRLKNVELIRELAKVGDICYLEIYRESATIVVNTPNVESTSPLARIWEGDIAYDPRDDHEIEQIWESSPRLRLVQ